jgi:hypothetical protein
MEGLGQTGRAARRKTWASIAIAAAIIAAAAAAILIATGAYILYRHTSARFVGADTAAIEFDRVQEQFADKQPLVELRGVDLPVVRRNESAVRREVHTLHVLSYDPRSRKLVKADIPGWTLKWMSAHGTIRLANLEMFDDARDRLTLEDIERHTPGIIITGRVPARVLVWTE